MIESISILFVVLCLYLGVHAYNKARVEILKKELEEPKFKSWFNPFYLSYKCFRDIQKKSKDNFVYLGGARTNYFPFPDPLDIAPPDYKSDSDEWTDAFQYPLDKSRVITIKKDE